MVGERSAVALCGIAGEMVEGSWFGGGGLSCGYSRKLVGGLGVRVSAMKCFGLGRELFLEKLGWDAGSIGWAGRKLNGNIGRMSR